MQKDKKRKKFSIRTQMLSFYTIMIIALFTSTGFFFFRSAMHAIRTTTESEYTIIARETADKINRFLFERYGDIQVLAKNPILTESTIGGESKRQYLDLVRTTYQTYDYIQIRDNQALLSVFSGLSPNSTEEDLIMNICRKDRIFVSNILVMQENPGILFAAPIYNENQKRNATVVERMNFHALRQIVETVRLGKHGYAYLLSEDYQTIFYPHGKQKISHLSLKNHREVVYTQIDKKKMLTIIEPLKIYETQDKHWYLVVETPEREALSVGYKIRDYNLSIILIAIIVLLLLGYLLSSIILYPIQKLVKETQKLARGEIPESLIIESKDELGSLASSINSIISNLQSLMGQVLEVSSQAASIKEIREYFNQLINDVQAGIITVDASGRISTFNTVASELSGISGSDLIGLSIESKLPFGLQPILELLRESIRKNSVFSKQVSKIYDIANQEIPIIFSTSHQMDNNGRIIGIIGIFRKLEEFKKFEENVSRAKTLASLGMMSAGIAHEIKNPLTSIRGYAQYIRSSLFDNKELVEDVDVIITEVDRLTKLIDRFLSFARPKTPVLVKQNINTLLAALIKLLKANIDHNIELVVFFLNVPDLAIDAELMEQAIMNLLLNAIQAMPQGGQLKILTEYKEKTHFVEISISDSGQGIDANDYEVIFEPFYTTKSKGTGLGLAITARIIEIHGGFIEIDSTQGKGTTFTIKLPCL